ncbi:MAG: NosD domain-containing protein [Bacteroidia bacterium]
MTFWTTYTSSNYIALNIRYGNNIKVQNCVMRGSGGGGYGLSCSRCDSAIYVQNCWAYNCSYSMFISDGILPYTKDVQIENNTITSVNEALYIHDIGNTTIKYNYIQGSYRGLEADGVEVQEIHHNTFRSSGGAALIMGNCYGPGNGRVRVYNNLVLTTATSQPTNYGASFYQVDGLEFVNNTIYFNSNYNYQAALKIDVLDSCFIYNNIIMNNGNGYAYQVTVNVYNEYSDYNTIYTNGTLISPGISTFAQWQSTYQMDFNSVYANPQFINIPNNLHPTNAIIDGLAIPWAGVTTDLSGIPRHPQYPDPGAYEFSVVPVANLGPNQTICGNSTVLNAGNNGSYYLWSNGATTQTINATSSGTYWVRINNLAGTSSDTINLTIHPLPGITINGSNSVCVNDSTQLSVTSPATTFSWSPSTGLDNPSSSIVNASPSSNTTYTIIVTDNFGCSNSDSITITVNTLPIAQAGSAQSICSGGQTAIGTASGMNCTWTPTVGLNLSTDCQPLASPVSTTNYILTVTDLNGCENSDSVLVTVNPLPSISVCCSQAICMNDTASITATSSGSNFSWSPATGLSATTGAMVDAFPTSTTTYTVTATDALSCQSSDTVTITIHPLPSVVVCCDQTLCAGDTVSLTATTSASNLSWSPSGGLNTTAGNNVNAFPGSSTTYTVTATDANGCNSAETVVLTVNPTPTTPIITQNTTDLISSEVTGNQWYLNGSIINSATGQTYTPIQNGNYTVVYTDLNGCSATSAIYFFGSTGVGNPLLANTNCNYSVENGQLSFINLPSGEYQLNIYNQLGQLILADNFDLAQISESFPLQITTGTYIVILNSSIESFRWKLIVSTD